MSDFNPGDIHIAISTVQDNKRFAFTAVLSEMQLADTNATACVADVAAYLYSKLQGRAEFVAAPAAVVENPEPEWVKNHTLRKQSTVPAEDDPQAPSAGGLSDKSLNMRAAKVAGIAVRTGHLHGNKVHRYDGCEWNPLANVNDCAHLIHSTPLQYHQTDNCTKWSVLHKNEILQSVVTDRGLHDARVRRMVVEQCIKWFETRND